MLHAAIDKTNVVRMREFISKSELRELGVDPRTAIKRLGLTPDAELVTGERRVKLYDREQVKAALAQSILEIAKKYEKES
jgi:hypothetical protein